MTKELPPYSKTGQVVYQNKYATTNKIKIQLGLDKGVYYLELVNED